MLFSTATGYALRALASMPEDGTFSLARDLSEDLELPRPYLAKILQSLAQSGLLESLRGPKGGFRLSRPASEITVGEIVAILEGTDTLGGCVMGHPDCGHNDPCPLHEAWASAQARIASTITQVTLRDLQQHRRRHHRPVEGILA